MFREITDNWPILACIALFFLIGGVSALIRKRVRWECFRAQVCAYVRAWASLTPGSDPDDAVYTARLELNRHANWLNMPSRDIIRSRWNYEGFSEHCLRVYADTYDVADLRRFLRGGSSLVESLVSSGLKYETIVSEGRSGS